MNTKILLLASSFLILTAQTSFSACFDEEYVPETITCGSTVDDGFADFQGQGCQIVPSHIKQIEKSCDIVVDVRSSRTGFAIKSLFDAEYPNEWQNPETNKIINIHPGVIVGSTSGDAVTVGSAWKGTLTMNLMGEIQGAGGSANGGGGGNALNANAVSATGAKMKVAVTSTGALRGGGGGGGKGGSGGAGGNTTTTTAGTTDKIYDTSTYGHVSVNYGANINFSIINAMIYWKGALVVHDQWTGPMKDAVKMAQARTFTGSDGATYKIVDEVNRLANTSTHYIGRIGNTSITKEGGVGGNGGNGGVGQGYRVSSAAGTAGTAGENAAPAGTGGKGGAGGNGGSWGVNGSNGAPGQNGNPSNLATGSIGTSGTSGGSAGRAIVSPGNVSLSLASGAEVNGAR